MNFNELIADGFNNELSSFKGKQANIWTAMPGVIQSFDATKMTVSVQPVIQGVVFKENTPPTNTNLPLLVDCPIILPSAGGLTITFPVAKGDECLIIFASRCIDNWWYLGAVDSNGNTIPRSQAEIRMHDLSDGFVILGPRSLPHVIQNYSTTDIQIRSNDGHASISINPTTHAININTNSTVSMTATNGVTVTTPTTTFNGDMHCTGTITGDTDVKTGTISLKNHTHSDPQGGTVGAPQ